MMNQHQSMGRNTCVSDGHQYHKPKLIELCRYSEAISSCWMELGLQLDLPFEIINTIDNDHYHINDKCRNMFITWLKRSPDACWCHLVNALKMHNMLQLAKNIEESFLSTTSLMDIGSSSNQSNNTSSSVEDEETKIMSSVLEVFQEHYPQLMKVLPMDDDYFIAELYAKNLLTGSLKADIESLSTIDRASKFLDDVIKPSVENNDCTKFHTLLRLMEKTDHSTIKALANKIRKSLNETIRSILNQASSDGKTISDIDITAASVLEIISKHLQMTYKRTRFIHQGTGWPPNQSKLIVSVALIHYKGKRTQQELFEMAFIHKEGALAVDKVTSDSLQGCSAKKPRLDYSRVTKNISDIFAADPTDLTETGTSFTVAPKRILIEGAPGIGKTVLAKEIAYCWATNEILPEIKIVFLLYLRDPQLQKIISTRQLVEYMSMGCIDDHQITVTSKYLVNENGQQLCIVMDGFDEYPSALQENSFFLDIIKGVILPEAIVVITSRPTATVSLHDQVDRRIDILGLSQEERVKYISQVLRNSLENRTKLERYLEQQPVINGLCFIPLHLAILLYLFQQGSLPETLTEMNQFFILHTIYRYLIRSYKLTPPGPVRKLEDLPKPVLDIVYKLSELAFKGLQVNKLVFTFDEIKQTCPYIDETVGAINGFGLLQVVEHYTYKGAGATMSFNFLHYTMQEFLAALYVSTLPSEQQSSLMKKTFWNHHYNFMWTMFVGIVGVKSDAFVNLITEGKGCKNKTGIRIAKSIIKNKRKHSHVFQCYREAKSIVEAADALQDTETFLEKAIEENQVIDFQHIKILLIGSAAVGKTSFCRLLSHCKFCSDYKSTEVIEANQAISVEANTNQNISVEQYIKLEQQAHKEIVWLKLDAKNRLAHFKSLLESRMFHVPEATTTIPEQITLQNSGLGSTDSAIIHEETVDKREIDNESKFSTFKTIIQEKSVGKVETEVKETTELKEKTQVKEKILSSDALPDALFIDEDNKSVKLITVIDAGGQPEYIHLLPAINSCPTISFIVLDMTKSLDEKVLVQYKSDYDKIEPYYLHYSNLDMIGLLMSLTVDSLEQKAENSHSRIGFVGTHKDVLIKKKIAEKTITEINSKLCQITDERIRKKLFSSNHDFLFPVDNTTAGNSDKEDPVVKELRKHIYDFMNDLLKSPESRSENKLPIKWMILELEIKELHLRKKEYLAYVDYKHIAHEKAEMAAEEANESLQHFNLLGVFLYFKEVHGLCDYVIINHKWLFKNLAKLLHLSADQINFGSLDHKEKFKDKRLLAKNEVDKIKWNETLSPEYFFNLLVHLKVIATVSLENEQYYYMPCIRSSTYHYHDKLLFLLSEPLLVQFSSGFLPRGFFGSLVVDLLENLPDKWYPQFHNTKHFSNVITIQLPDDSFLRLHDKLYYLEMQIRDYKIDLKVDYHAEVFPKLCEHLHRVCKKLNFDYEKLKYGFWCHDSKFYDDEHIAIINPSSPLSSNLQCMPSKIRCCRKDAHQLTLDESSHKIWFRKITNEASSEQSQDMQSSGRFDCEGAAETLRKMSKELTNLRYKSMQNDLYAKGVITRIDMENLDKMTNNEQMLELIKILIESLESKSTKKYKWFLKSLEESEDVLLPDMAQKLGE